MEKIENSVEMKKLQKEILKREESFRKKLAKEIKGMPRRKLYMQLLESETEQMKTLIENATVNSLGEVKIPIAILSKVENHSLIRSMLLRIMLEKEGVKVAVGTVAYSPKKEKEEPLIYIR